MFTKHLLKVIIGFCGMIIFGLFSLVIFDSIKDKNQSATVTPALKVVPPAVKEAPKPQTKTTTNKAPVKNQIKKTQ